MRRVLAQQAGNRADAGAIAAATINLWEKISTQLDPLIGKSGVHALHLRSLHITQSTFPWLAAALLSDPLAGTEQTRFSAMGASLAQQESGEALDAGATLIMTFIKLLESMIGPRLTIRFLSSTGIPMEIPEPAAQSSQGAGQ